MAYSPQTAQSRRFNGLASQNRQDSRFPNRDDSSPAADAIPAQTGNRIWKLIYAYRIAEANYADVTMGAQLPGGVLIRTTTKTSKGNSQALQYVPGLKLADLMPATGRAAR